LPYKIGQILGTTQLKTSSPVYSAVFEDKGALSHAEFEYTLNASWSQAFPNGPTLAETFSEIEPVGAGASLAQVHRARRSEGRVVAIKLLYPDSRACLKSDVGVIGMLLLPIGALRSRRQLTEYRTEVQVRMRRETDYREEVRNMLHFQALLRDEETLVVPAPHLALCSDDFIVMDWMDGAPFSEALTWSREEQESVGGSLTRLFIRGVFEWGIVHADPNPGNYRFLRRPGAAPVVQILDFGSVYTLTAQEQAGWLMLKEAVESGGADEATAVGAFIKLGFDASRLTDLAFLLPAIANVILRPFIGASPLRSRKWELARELHETLGAQRMAFRAAGPPRFLFFIRAFQGLLHQLDALDATFDPRDPGSTTREKLISVAPKSQDVPVADPELPRLHVEVTRDGTVTAAITLPNHAITTLEDLIPADVRERLAAEGTDLKSVIDSAQSRHREAGEIAMIGSAERRIRIWLA
jgi:hypothetical protein